MIDIMSNIDYPDVPIWLRITPFQCNNHNTGGNKTINRNRTGTMKSCVVINKLTKEEKHFKSRKEAAEITGIPEYTFIRILKGYISNNYDFYFENNK